MEVTRIHIEGIVKGLGINGVRETFIDTTDPKYYKWTQWIFLQL